VEILSKIELSSELILERITHNIRESISEKESNI